MKTKPYATGMVALLCVSVMGMLPVVQAQSTNPSVPVGSLTAFPTVVQTGTKPSLLWEISYPSIVKDVINLTPPTSGSNTTVDTTITPKVDLIADIRVLGAGVTTQDSRGRIVFIRTIGQLRCNGASSFTTIFDGVNTDTIVQQQGIIKTLTVNRNKPMYFGGYYIYNGSNGPKFTSLSGDNVRTLVNGDIPPSNIPDYNAPSLESFIKPYLDPTGKVKIGPMDVIIFMELTHTDKSDIGYDLQDLVFLVTFRPA